MKQTRLAKPVTSVVIFIVRTAVVNTTLAWAATTRVSFTVSAAEALTSFDMFTVSAAKMTATVVVFMASLAVAYVTIANW